MRKPLLAAFLLAPGVLSGEATFQQFALRWGASTNVSIPAATLATMVSVIGRNAPSPVATVDASGVQVFGPMLAGQAVVGPATVSIGPSVDGMIAVLKLETVPERVRAGGTVTLQSSPDLRDWSDVGEMYVKPQTNSFYRVRIQGN